MNATMYWDAVVHHYIYFTPGYPHSILTRVKHGLVQFFVPCSEGWVSPKRRVKNTQVYAGEKWVLTMGEIKVATATNAVKTC